MAVTLAAAPKLARPRPALHARPAPHPQPSPAASQRHRDPGRPGHRWRARQRAPSPLQHHRRPHRGIEAARLANALGWSQHWRSGSNRPRRPPRLRLRTASHGDPARHRHHHHSARTPSRRVWRRLHPPLSPRRGEDRYLNGPLTVIQRSGWSAKTRRPSAASTGSLRSTPSKVRMKQTPNGMRRASGPRTSRKLPGRRPRTARCGKEPR
jgi:hypothetical protein